MGDTYPLPGRVGRARGFWYSGTLAGYRGSQNFGAWWPGVSQQGVAVYTNMTAVPHLTSKFLVMPATASLHGAALHTP